MSTAPAEIEPVRPIHAPVAAQVNLTAAIATAHKLASSPVVVEAHVAYLQQLYRRGLPLYHGSHASLQVTEALVSELAALRRSGLPAEVIESREAALRELHREGLYRPDLFLCRKDAAVGILRTTCLDTAIIEELIEWLHAVPEPGAKSIPAQMLQELIDVDVERVLRNHNLFAVQQQERDRVRHAWAEWLSSLYREGLYRPRATSYEDSARGFMGALINRWALEGRSSEDLKILLTCYLQDEWEFRDPGANQARPLPSQSRPQL